MEIKIDNDFVSDTEYPACAIGQGVLIAKFRQLQTEKDCYAWEQEYGLKAQELPSVPKRYKYCLSFRPVGEGLRFIVVGNQLEDMREVANRYSLLRYQAKAGDEEDISQCLFWLDKSLKDGVEIIAPNAYAMHQTLSPHLYSDGHNYPTGSLHFIVNLFGSIHYLSLQELKARRIVSPFLIQTQN